jgi:tetratricopeptide (TPR) repeat protein
VTAAILFIIALQAAAPQAPAAAPDRAALLVRADEAVQRGDRAEAKRLLGIAGERHKSVRALMLLARLQSEDGDAAAAIGSLRAARTLAPNAEDVLSAFAEVSLRTGAPVPGILALESLARLWPAEPKYAYLLGVGLMAAGDMPAATDALRRANTLEPGRPLTLLALGLAYNNQKLYTEARPLLRRALDLHPSSVEALAALAEAEAGEGDLDAAERDAARVLERAPRNATANLVAGMVHMARRRYAEARDAFDAAVAADPASPRPEYQLSLVHARLGDQGSADRHLARYREKLRALEAALKALQQAGAGGPAK